METDSSSLDSRNREASSEAASTRPNPFDDTDASSRKRRRTSPSGSPTLSVNAMDPGRDSPRSSTLEPESATAEESEATAADETDEKPATPKTPEQLSPENETALPDTTASSSKVTINLRNAMSSDTPESDPESPTVQLESGDPSPPSPSSSPSISPSPPAEIKTSVEDPEVEIQPRARSVRTPQSSSTSPGSLPIEIIPVQSDDEMSIEQPAIIEPDQDPIVRLPYRDASETVTEVLNRLLNYIHNRERRRRHNRRNEMLSPTIAHIDITVLSAFHQWQREVVNYLLHVDIETAHLSVRRHSDFWSLYPEIISAVFERRPSLLNLEHQHLRPTILDLFASFSRIVAYMITYDLGTLRGLPPNPQERPVVLAPLFIRRYLLITHPRLTSNDDVYPLQPGEVAYPKRSFFSQTGSSLESITELARGLIDLARSFPKLLDGAAITCHLVRDFLPDSTTAPNEEVALQKQLRLETGHVLHDHLHATLNAMIERQVTSLSGDTVSPCIDALAMLLQRALRGTHARAVELRRLHQASYPDIPPELTIDALVWEERFDILARLIRSSQMQLRVTATATMCNDLLGSYSSHNQPGNEPTPYLIHLAKYLLRSQLIEYILGPNCHPEIINDTANIVGFLAVTQTYRQEDSDLLLQTLTSGQDPRIVEALTRMITGIVHLFDYGTLLVFCDKLGQIPFEGYTPCIRLLWDHVIRSITKKDARVMSYVPADLCLRLIRDSCTYALAMGNANDSIRLAAVQRLQELQDWGPRGEISEYVRLNCIEDIKRESSTSLGSLWGLSLSLGSNSNAEIRSLSHTHDLPRLIVEEFVRATREARESGVPTVLSGLINQPRKDFIGLVIGLEPLMIDAELGKKLWNSLVGTESLCLEDRTGGWKILNDLLRSQPPENPFLQVCLSQYLPTLPPSLFCDGMLQFVREEVLLPVNRGDISLNDETTVGESGIEQLWRLILEAKNASLIDRSIGVLVEEIYADSDQIKKNTRLVNRRIHLGLIDRCLRQLREAAGKIRATHAENMTDVEMEDLEAQNMIFTRSLMTLNRFLQEHKTRPHLAIADLRPLIPSGSYQVEGDSADLKYQSFDGDQQTDIKPLNIGKLNTGGSLLASIRKETGFSNYRMYYRGQEFLPSERDICKSLEDLRFQDGLILVRRDDGGPAEVTHIRPGASSLEIEVSAHFSELWEYLSMEEKLAGEIYSFLVKLPPNGQVLDFINDPANTFQDIFPPRQPFKSLYALYVIREYANGLFSRQVLTESPSGSDQPSPSIRAARRPISLIIQACLHPEVTETASPTIGLDLMYGLTCGFMHFLHKMKLPRGGLERGGIDTPRPAQLLTILHGAANKREEAAASVVSSVHGVILQLTLLDEHFAPELIQSNTFAALTHQLLLSNELKEMRDMIAGQIQNFVSQEIKYKNEQSGSLPAATYLTPHYWSLVLDILPHCSDDLDKCEQVFGLALFLLDKMGTEFPDRVNISGVAASLAETFLGHTTNEVVGQDSIVDPVARGFASLLQKCLKLDDSVPRSSLLPHNLSELLLTKHMYPMNRQPNQPIQPIVLNSMTRQILSDVIFGLVAEDRSRVAKTLDLLNSLVPYFSSDQEEVEPYLYELPYQFDNSKMTRAPCGYVGLLNLSNTCYLNALLTQLFSNYKFRQFMMKARVYDSEDTQNLIFQTQTLFGYMQDSYRRYADPTNFVSSIKTYDDTPIDVSVQMDAEEGYNLLQDRWEGQLALDEEKRMLRSFYGGQLVQQVKSKECQHISERLEPFATIQCDIKGKTSLVESLQAYVDGEVMEGDNKYKCSTCDRHVDAVKRACLRDVPDNLIFHLKRFDFNLRTQQRSKINDYFSFPREIDMRPYTIEHISDPTSSTEPDIFELVGILVHSGTAESGHYYSFIRERPTSNGTENWLEFNDDTVTTWDSNGMQGATFGGVDHRPSYDGNVPTVAVEKAYSAYMLFYQRASSLRADQEGLKVPTPISVELPAELREFLFNENTVLLRRHCLFDRSHDKLVSRLFERAKDLCIEDDGDPSTLSSDDSPPSGKPHNAKIRDVHLKCLTMRTALSHLDQIVTRAKDMPAYNLYSKMIEDTAISSPGWAFAFFSYFNSRPGVMRVLLQRIPDPKVRGWISRLFPAVLKVIRRRLPSLYSTDASQRSISASDDDDSDPGLDESLQSHPHVLDGAMRIFHFAWRHFHVHVKSWDEHFNMLLNFAQLGHRETSYLLADGYLLRLIRIISADSELEMSPNYARMWTNVSRRQAMRPVSYVAIIALLRYLMLQMEPEFLPTTIVDDAWERADRSPPFAWWAAEIGDMHHDLVIDDSRSHFVEKLLAIDQNPEDTIEVFRFLIKASAKMDLKVYHTLEQCLTSELAKTAMEPYLKAAAIYLDCTHDVDNARGLIRHICTQVKQLRGTEGDDFIAFYKAALHLTREEKLSLWDESINLVPRWVPTLLTEGDATIRARTEEFVEVEVFQPAYQTLMESDEAQVQLVILRSVIKLLGVECLVHLQENYIHKRRGLGQDAAERMERVVEECRRAFEENDGPQDDIHRQDFVTMRPTVLGAIRRTTVADMDDDQSDWEESGGTSEPLDDIVDMGASGVNELSDMDMT